MHVKVYWLQVCPNFITKKLWILILFLKIHSNGNRISSKIAQHFFNIFTNPNPDEIHLKITSSSYQFLLIEHQKSFSSYESWNIFTRNDTTRYWKKKVEEKRWGKCRAKPRENVMFFLIIYDLFLLHIKRTKTENCFPLINTEKFLFFASFIQPQENLSQLEVLINDINLVTERSDNDDPRKHWIGKEMKIFRLFQRKSLWEELKIIFLCPKNHVAFLNNKTWRECEKYSSYSDTF